MKSIETRRPAQLRIGRPRKVEPKPVEDQLDEQLPSSTPVEDVQVEDSVDKKKNRRLLTGGESDTPRGVVLLNKLPRGFAEPQLRTFFSQFGGLTRLRLIRSKTTTNSKGYAFIEFDSIEIAKIAADTMNGYMMFGTIIKAKLLPQSSVPKGLFTNYKKYLRKGYGVDSHRRAIASAAAGEITPKRINRLAGKEVRKRDLFKQLGLTYKNPYLVDAPPTIKSKLKTKAAMNK